MHKYVSAIPFFGNWRNSNRIIQPRTLLKKYNADLVLYFYHSLFYCAFFYIRFISLFRIFFWGIAERRSPAGRNECFHAEHIWHKCFKFFIFFIFSYFCSVGMTRNSKDDLVGVFLILSQFKPWRRIPTFAK